MNLLEAAKLGFFVCIVGCIIIFAFVYVRNTIPKEDNERELFPEIAECGDYPNELCSALFEGKAAASQIGHLCQQVLRRQEMSICIEMPCNCSTLQKELHFITSPLSEEEGNFSLAYIITIHKELDMFIKLLRAIYVPQNVYCIHIDEKSSKDYKLAVQTVVNCFENIFIASKVENVVYAGFSRLQADINCMKDLVHSKNQWNYVINLCGQDYPIKTNKEVMQYIKSKWNGKNMTPGIVQPPHMKHRTHKTSTTWVTLLSIWLLDAPGATPDAQWEGNIRAIKWRDQEGIAHNGCQGHYVRDICVYGIGDLKWIVESPNLFANKFESATYPLVMECLERHYRLKVLQEAEVPLETHWHL
ncbi:beta-1,3-galactosyl-O-glycosyl-glycoprotein beta-1,6-N-acetylglucosaminyltransferase 7-like isoform X3 [Rhineura floridana]|uniref:beta-1,3-galactosyl-O-glycosyl-glycoprotein beta-1,6-N-acetylglucosaminyltransferase 7-like isoform X3 n=1 Tax=Rhineura floridana TaxID=261503 RepID=UPI002AC80C8C|nr:beta-1,3-galactosyl-O-glycosyl-glycoprotein beta-1,6-N-acetylglucosaminyltransferase 7-like isoform X3 [Rhineura floridana]